MFLVVFGPRELQISLFSNYMNKLELWFYAVQCVQSVCTGSMYTVHAVYVFTCSMYIKIVHAVYKLLPCV